MYRALPHNPAGPITRRGVVRVHGAVPPATLISVLLILVLILVIVLGSHAGAG
jgi:hypothetical protein